MTDIALPGSIEPARRRGPDLDRGFHPLSGILFMGVVAATALFVAYSIRADMDAVGARITTYVPFILLFVALLTALGFEFVNGFHDTANAVDRHLHAFAASKYRSRLVGNVQSAWSSAVVGSGRIRHRFATSSRADFASR